MIIKNKTKQHVLKNPPPSKKKKQQPKTTKQQSVEGGKKTCASFHDKKGKIQYVCFPIDVFYTFLFLGRWVALSFMLRNS